MSGHLGASADGTLYVLVDGHTIYRRPLGGTLAQWAGGSTGHVDGALASARFAAMQDVAIDAAGNLYITEGFATFHGYCSSDQVGNQIRKISAAGQVTTLAGQACQLGSTDGVGSAARFDAPTGIVVDAGGTLYVIDSGNFTIRRITADGTVTTLAGVAGQSGTADGTGSAARFLNPRSLTINGSTLYLLDGPTAAPLLRRVETSGQVTTLATLAPVKSISGDGTGFVAAYSSTISSMTTAGTLTTLAGVLPDPNAGPGSVDGLGATARFRDLRGIVRDDRGGVYLTDATNQTIRYVSASGVVSTIAGSPQQAGLVDGAGSEARFQLPQGITRAGDGTLYVADEYNDRIRRVTPAGVVSTLALTPANPVDITVDQAGNVYAADSFGPLRRITPQGVISTFLDTVSVGILAEPGGTFIVAIPGSGSRRFAADGTAGALLSVPVQTVDAAGRLYAQVTDNNQVTTIRRIDPDNTEHTFATVMPVAGSINVHFSDLAVTEAGDIYLTRGVELLLGTLTPRTAPTVGTPTSTAVWIGQTAQLTATVSGTPQPAVHWQRSTDGGTTWADVTNDATYSGALTATLSVTGTTAAMASHRFRLVATNIEGTTNSAAAALSLNGVFASPSALYFAGRKPSPDSPSWVVTAPQMVTVTTSGTPVPVWTATVSHPWMAVTGGSGTGAGQFTVSIVQSGLTGLSGQQTGTITVSASNVGVTTVVPVTLTLDATTGFKNSTIGMVDTPVQNASGIQGAIAMTGWVVSDINAGSVKIYRNCASFESTCVTTSGLPQMGPVVEVGDATMVEGARPDIEALYPQTPGVRRAGWGLMILTNMLPNVPAQTLTGGVGSFTFYAVAFGGLAAPKILGRTTLDELPTQISVSNDTIAKPFGAIDTPGQGATVSGTVNNFGWVLTPDPGTGVLVPTDGSTISVFVDGAPVGTATYNLCRGTVAVNGVVPSGQLCNDDVSSAFRGNGLLFRNLDAGRGPIGLRSLDVSGLSNGLHTLSWSVTDSANRSEGIGSRYINVLNGTADTAAPALRDSGTSALRDFGTPIYARTGFDVSTAYVPLRTDADGVAQVRIPELGRVELALPGVDAGALLVNGDLRPLPIGVKIDRERGLVTWAPGPGFLGTYRLAVRTSEPRDLGTSALRHPGTSEPRLVDVTVVPAQLISDAAPRMHVDSVTAAVSARGGRIVRVEGWALDTGAASGAGVGAVHVWAKRRGAEAAESRGAEVPVFLGVADLGLIRPDVAAAHGDQFLDAGFRFTGSVPDAGEWEITAYVWLYRTGRFEDARVVTAIVR